MVQGREIKGLMPSSNRDLLFLLAALAVATCLTVAGIVIYPDDRRVEVGLSAAEHLAPAGGAGRNH
jgi:hypothetical protein